MTVAQRRGLLGRVAVDVTPLRESPAFRRLWLGQAVTYFAWRMTLVLVPVQVYRLTGSTLAVGLLALTQFVPLVTVTIVSGAVADVLDRRVILLVSGAGVVVGLAAFAANAALPHPSVAACFGISLFTYTLYALSPGAMRGVVPRLVAVEQLASASALTGLYSNLGSIAGPALGGALIPVTGLATAYAISAAGCLAGMWGILGLPSIRAETGEDARVSVRSIVEGFRYLAGQHVVLAFFLIDTVAMVFGMPNALFPAVAKEFYGDPGAVGWLYAAPAAGAFLASLTSGWAAHLRRQGIAIVVAASSWGAAIASFGLTHMLWLGALLLVLAGGADQISAIFRSTIMLTVTPDHLLGRLGGIEFAQVASTPALGNVEAGVVASLVGLRFSIVSGGVACVAGTIAVALSLPVLLRYDAAAP